MKSEVIFIPLAPDAANEIALERIRECLISRDLLSFVDERDMVALKTHFGEGPKSGFVRPPFLKLLGDLVKSRDASPFLTETQTLYKGNRTNAVLHLSHAARQGFGYEVTGLPLIMADGLYGDDETDVSIPGRIYDSVKIATLITRIQALIMVTHFTGHLATGFGGALKNMGMGCASRRGKMIQHSTSKPKIRKKKCTKCNMCVEWCPASAITMTEEGAVIDREVCIGCGQCLAVCRFDAVAYNWGATHEDLQKKMVEHAMGVAEARKDRILYINFLTSISKDCDCMNVYENIAPDIGILISRDPVAIDAASLDLIEETTGEPFSSSTYNVPYRVQIEYAHEIGLGNAEYELVSA